jgi:metal-sulfur cluster biosynthetic enzyme
VTGAIPESVIDAIPKQDRLRQALRDVEDPEMPVNIVDLGIVYGVRQEAGRAIVDLTFTAMGCPAADLILEDVEQRLLQEPGVEQVEVNVVWDPPWSASRLTPAGREALEMWGLAV